MDMVHGTDPRPIPKVDAVMIGPGRTIDVRWRGGGEARIDLTGWIALHDIESLRDDAVFATAAPGEHGGSVCWNGDEDLAIDTVHMEMLAEQQAEFGGTDAAAFQERRGLSNQEAADALGVALNTWLHYKSGHTRIPRGVAIACRAMERDDLVFEAHYRPRRNGRPPASA